VQQTDIRPGDLLALDFEDTKGGHPSAADGEAFKAEVKRLEPGFRVGTYCNVWDWKNTAIKAGDFLWIAAPSVSKPDISATWAFWQYSKTSDAGEAIDQNRAQFDSLDSLKAWANGARYSIDYQSLYVGWKGTSEWVTPRDNEILLAIEKELKPWFGEIRIVQGGLSMGTKSAYTHAGLGSFDVSVKNPFTLANDYHDLATVLKAAAVFNRAGLLFFIRGYEIGNYDDKWDDRHGHVVSWESYANLHRQAKDQIQEYLRWLDGNPDGDGLTTLQQYPGLRIPSLEHWVTSPYNPANIKSDLSRYVVDVDALYGRDVDNKIVRKRARGYVIQAARQVKRWDRWNVVTSSGTYYAAQYLTLAN
jgi:hypothetical protein